MQYCKLTGIDLRQDGATNGFKCMCLNCKSCYDGDGQFVCDNENVMEISRKKILASLPEGVEIKTLELNPMKLKDPTKKCKNHSFDIDKVVEYLEEYFTTEPENQEKENASE